MEINIRPLGVMSAQDIMDYWEALAQTDHLANRLCDVENPTVETALDMCMRFRSSMYYMLDEHHKVIGEFMLENFSGKSAQIHFSMRPDNDTRLSLTAARKVIDNLLNVWKVVNSDEPYLRTLFGLVPELNKRAVAFCSHTQLSIVHKIPFGSEYLGEICDAVLFMKTRRN